MAMPERRQPGRTGPGRVPAAEVAVEVMGGRLVLPWEGVAQCLR